MQEFSAQQGKEPKSTVTVAKLMSQLQGKAEVPARPPSSVVTGEGLLALPRKWVERIQAGDYIDFAELPPAKGKSKGMPSSLEDQILVVQAADIMESRKMIPDLATWVQCFSVYMAMVTAKEPVRTNNLLAYQAIIAKCSQKF